MHGVAEGIDFIKTGGWRVIDNAAGQGDGNAFGGDWADGHCERVAVRIRIVGEQFGDAQQERVIDEASERVSDSGWRTIWNPRDDKALVAIDRNVNAVEGTMAGKVR